MSSLTDSILQQYPGAYDHLDPADIEQAVIKQYPGAYDHMMEHIDTLNKDSAKPQSDLEKAVSFISNMYSKDPSKESNILPDIKQPETFTGGFLKSLYDQYIKPMGTVPGIAELMGGVAAGGIHDVPSSPTMKPSDTIERQLQAARTSPSPNLPEFTAVGDEPQFSPRNLDPTTFKSPAAVNDPNYFRIGSRDIYPSKTGRQSLMSETGGLGSGGAPKSEDYLQARQFFRDQGKEIPKDVQSKATDMEYDEKTGLFHATDTKGKPVGTFDESGNALETPKITSADEGPDFLTKASNLAGKFSRSVLGMHIPGTALSFHGMNEMARDVLFGGNLLGAPARAFEDLKMLAMPGKASELLKNIDPQQMTDMVKKGGVQMMSPDVDMPSLFKGNNPLSKAYNFMTNPKPLFQQVIPAMKAKTYGKYLNQLTQAGVPENEAHQVAGNFVNNIFGGVTPEKLMGDPSFRKVSKLFAMAPDWMASNFRLGQGIAKGLANPMDPRNRAYMNGAVNLAATYSAANIMNYMNTGHLMFQNEPGKEFSIAMGSVDRPDGKKATRYLEPFGTAVDFARLPVAIAHSAVSGDPGASFKLIGNLARNRLNPIMSFGADMMFNQDYSGKPLYGKTKYGRHTIDYPEESMNIGSDAASHVLPIGLEGVSDYLRGKGSLEEMGAKLSQAPLGYRLPAKGWREEDQ